MFKTYPMSNSAILRLNSERGSIDTQPDYQRLGGIWTLAKKQLLIDSILNDFDIPKLYFHALDFEQRAASSNRFNYAIIDGRQRLEAIWEFLDDTFPLAQEFEYFGDSGVRAAGMTYSELATHYPKLRVRFDSYSLPVVLVEASDADLIEDMFSRLNEAVPLRSAEKRNALGGPMARGIRNLASHPFFHDRVRFNNRRYQHLEGVAKLLYLEYCLVGSRKLYDTKREYLDTMVLSYRESDPPVFAPSMPTVEQLVDRVTVVLDALTDLFETADSLLRAQAIVVVYYLAMRRALEVNLADSITRAGLLNFISAVEENRRIAEVDITKANFDYLEFDRMSQQGTNDAASIRERTKIMLDYFQISNDYR